MITLAFTDIFKEKVVATQVGIGLEVGILGDGVNHAMRGIARLHNLNLAG